MSTLLERAQREGTPLIDGDRATFVWQGGGDVPKLAADFTNWSEEAITLEEVEAGVWAHTITLPLDAYIEYQYQIAYDITERFPDPFNPRLIYNGVDSVNHYFSMPDYRAPELTKRKAGVPRGAITEHILKTSMETATTHRKVSLYHPPVDEPTPLLVVWDGSDYLTRGSLNVIVDNLIAQGRIRPIAMALIDNGEGARFVEYMQNEATVGLLTRLILPFANQHLNLIDAAEQPGIHGVLGSSMGGLMALYTGVRLPNVFGHVVSQSGAFFIGDPDHEMLIVNYIRQNPTPPIKVWQDVGTFEFLIDGNRKMNALLREKGYDVTYRECSGGHNQATWSDNTWRGLEAVYGVGVESRR